MIMSLHVLLGSNGPIQAHVQTSTYDEECQYSHSPGENRMWFHR